MQRGTSFLNTQWSSSGPDIWVLISLWNKVKEMIMMKRSEPSTERGSKQLTFISPKSSQPTVLKWCLCICRQWMIAARWLACFTCFFLCCLPCAYLGSSIVWGRAPAAQIILWLISYHPLSLAKVPVETNEIISHLVVQLTLYISPSLCFSLSLWSEGGHETVNNHQRLL